MRSIPKGAACRKPFLPPKLVLFGSVKSLTQGPGGGSNFDGGSTMSRTGMGMGMSDPRAKENLVLIGHHPLGFGLYLFDYRPQFRGQYGHGRQFGVMADEVQAAVPNAVMRAPDGYLRVDYSYLNIFRPIRPEAA